MTCWPHTRFKFMNAITNKSTVHIKSPFRKITEQHMAFHLIRCALLHNNDILNTMQQKVYPSVWNVKWYCRIALRILYVVNEEQFIWHLFASMIMINTIYTVKLLQVQKRKIVFSLQCQLMEMNNSADCVSKSLCVCMGACAFVVSNMCLSM